MIQGKAFGENTDTFLAMEKHKDAEVVGLFHLSLEHKK